jgi:hypothetical protein
MLRCGHSDAALRSSMVVVGGVTGDVKKCTTCFHHLCQPYRSFGKRQRTILSGTTCAVRVQSGVRITKFSPRFEIGWGHRLNHRHGRGLTSACRQSACSVSDDELAPAVAVRSSVPNKSTAGWQGRADPHALRYAMCQAQDPLPFASSVVRRRAT